MGLTFDITLAQVLRWNCGREGLVSSVKIQYLNTKAIIRKYQIGIQERPYFITFTVIHWIDVIIC